MRKKNRVMIVIVAFVVIAISILSYSLQKNRQNPEERIAQKASATDTVKSAENGKKQTEDSSINENEQAGDNVLMIGAVKLEMLSAKVYEGDDISNETEYPVSFFQYQTLPEPQVSEEEKDWDSIYEEAPDVKKVQYADYGVYPIEYILQVMDENSDVIDKYTYTKIKPQKLYFIKCRLTNLSSAAIEDALPIDITTVSSNSDEMTYVEDICYFDKPVYTDGDERYSKYFFFRLDGKESVECTIGFAVPQEYDKGEKHYYGNPISGDENGISYDPSILPDFIDIDALPETK